jgi:hypothetical protein
MHPVSNRKPAGLSSGDPPLQPLMGGCVTYRNEPISILLLASGMLSNSALPKKSPLPASYGQDPQYEMESKVFHNANTWSSTMRV